MDVKPIAEHMARPDEGKTSRADSPIGKNSHRVTDKLRMLRLELMVANEVNHRGHIEIDPLYPTHPINRHVCFLTSDIDFDWAHVVDHSPLHT